MEPEPRPPLRLLLREGPGLHRRCAYCHDLLGLAPELACAGCGTLLHLDCAPLAGGCPTLGCRQRATVRVRAWARRRRGPPPAPPQQAVRPQQVGRLLGAVVLPLACFVVSELFGSGLACLIHPGHAPTWLELALAPEGHRALYPLLVWAMASYEAALTGRRAPWIRTGLAGGVLLALAFSVLFLPLLPFSCRWILPFGMGLLGLAPFVALELYLEAYLRLRREERAAMPEPTPPRFDRATLVPWAVWLLLAAAGLAGVLLQVR